MFDFPEKIERKKESYQRNQEIHEFFVDLFAGVPRPNNEAVVAMAWRLTRRLAHLKGILRHGELLRAATNIDPSPWDRPVKSFQGAPEVHDLALRSLQITPASLQPPEVPAERSNWVAIMRMIGYKLAMHEKVKNRYTLEALLSVPEEYWPSPDTIMLWEETIIQDVLDWLIDSNFKTASNRLQEEYYLTLEESFELINMAQSLALPVTMAPQEVLRAISVLRLEDLIRRCKLDQNFRTELMAIKALNKLLGLNRPVPLAIDNDDDFVKKMEDVIETEAIPTEEKEEDSTDE